jgi:hypothetical protein
MDLCRVGLYGERVQSPIPLLLRNHRYGNSHKGQSQKSQSDADVHKQGSGNLMGISCMGVGTCKGS